MHGARDIEGLLESRRGESMMLAHPNHAERTYHVMIREFAGVELASVAALRQACLRGDR